MDSESIPPRGSSNEERVKLPGFGLSIDEFPFGPDDGPRRLRFPHAIADAHASQGVTVRERRMLDFINQITDKEGWERKVFDETITNKWKAEACCWSDKLNDDYLSLKMFDYCLKELREKAELFKETDMVSVLDCELAVAKSDTIVPKKLRDSLLDLVRVLEDIPEKEKDWHPGSGNQVLDLLHPSLFPLIYGTSRALPTSTVPLESCSKYIGTGIPVDPPLSEDDQIHVNELNFVDYAVQKSWGNYQWLPSDVSFDEGGAPQITSYINNLHPLTYKDLYKTFENFVAKAIPLWNESLSWFQPRFRMQRIYGSDEDWTVPQEIKYTPTRSDPETNKIYEDILKDDGADEAENYLRPKTLEEVRKDQDLYYTDNFQDWFRSHRTLIQREPDEYQPREKFQSASDHSPVNLQEDFKDSGLQIIFKLANIHLTPEDPEYRGGTWHVEGALNEHICATALYYYDEKNISPSHLAFRQALDAEELTTSAEQGEYQSMEAYYGITHGSGAIQTLGSVLTCSGRLIAFPNVLQHQVQPFRLTDPTEPGHRKILAMFLVDPHIRVLSTANVPPQRKDWWAPEIRKVRPFDKLPLEIFQMIMCFVDFPLGWETALKVRENLMGERSTLVNSVNESMNEAEFSFCEH